VCLRKVLTIDGLALCKVAVVLTCEEGIAVTAYDAFYVSGDC